MSMSADLLCTTALFHQQPHEASRLSQKQMMTEKDGEQLPVRTGHLLPFITLASGGPIGVPPCVHLSSEAALLLDSVRTVSSLGTLFLTGEMRTGLSTLANHGVLQIYGEEEEKRHHNNDVCLSSLPSTRFPVHASSSQMLQPGLYVWSQPLDGVNPATGADMKILVFEVQRGHMLSSVSACDIDEWLGVLLVSLPSMLASMIWYNAIGTIDSQILQKFQHQLIIPLSSLTQYLPSYVLCPSQSSLCWIARDCDLIGPGPVEYFEWMLSYRECEASKAIKQHFRQRRFIQIPHPGAHTSFRHIIAQSMHSIARNHVNPGYLTAMDTLAVIARQHTPALTDANNHALSGGQFIELVKSCVGSLNHAAWVRSLTPQSRAHMRNELKMHLLPDLVECIIAPLLDI